MPVAHTLAPELAEEITLAEVAARIGESLTRDEEVDEAVSLTSAFVSLHPEDQAQLVALLAQPPELVARTFALLAPEYAYIEKLPYAADWIAEFQGRMEGEEWVRALAAKVGVVAGGGHGENESDAGNSLADVP